MRREPRPCGALERVERWNRWVGQGAYELGTGNYKPRPGVGGIVDLPWTTHHKTGHTGSDCAGYTIAWGCMLTRHRPGFARVDSSLVAYDIDDDINCNSAIEDARTERDLFELVTTPREGDILAYPTIQIRGADGTLHKFIGHCAGVVSCARALEWNPVDPDYSLLDIVQCRGPNQSSLKYRRAGVVRTDGSVFDAHDAKWSKEEHRTVILRPIA